MVQETTLNDREALILQAVVHCYVTTAEPVGSRVIVKRFGLDLSPATVRNVMADLEEAGYLQQLHTSSGRVPTDLGYRYYVNYLMNVQELTAAERTRIERELSNRLSDADEIMRQTSQLLALISHQTGMVQTPDENTANVRHIEVMPISASRAAVLVADSLGTAHTSIVPLDEIPEAEELQKLNNFLNENLRGTALDQLAPKLQNVVRSLVDEQRHLADWSLRLMNLLPSSRRGQLYLEGAAQLFENPEFQDVERAREVFGILEERDRLMDLLRTRVAARDPIGASVVIGSETHEPGLREISLVASPYRVGEQTVGMLGVLGPRRMPYSRLTAVVNYTADMVSNFLTRLAG